MRALREWKNMHENQNMNDVVALPRLPMDLTAELLEVAQIPQPRCPVVLLLDTSESMAGEPIAELQQGLLQFISEMRSDVKCRQSVA